MLEKCGGGLVGDQLTRLLHWRVPCSNLANFQNTDPQTKEPIKKNNQLKYLVNEIIT